MGAFCRRRQLWLVIALLVAFGGILWRLYLLQVAPGYAYPEDEANLVAGAKNQQQREWVVDSGRGRMLDRHNRPFTVEKEWHLIVFPMNAKQCATHQKELQKVARVLHISFSFFSQRLVAIRSPQAFVNKKGEAILLTSEQVQQIKEQNIPGIYALQSDNRMGNAIARAGLGRIERNPLFVRRHYPEEWNSGVYTAQSSVGISGLEATFEPFLRGGEEERIVYHIDGRGKPLNGTMVTQKPRNKAVFPYQVVTTLDKQIQQLTEEVLETQQVRTGAVVVQDIKTGDILAMASRPREDHLQKGGNRWDNRALMETTPGSIFKTVTAVAALETGKVKLTDSFFCDGKLEQHKLTDRDGKGHGKQTFAEAYANSCNIVFAKVAQKVGGKTLEAYGRRMGLSQPILWQGKVLHDKDFHQLNGEESGHIFAPETSPDDAGSVVQTGIGQRDVRITPLQAVNMVTTLFHSGKPVNPRIVKEIRHYDGSRFFLFPKHEINVDHDIHQETLRKVREMMRLTVTRGTAQAMSKAGVTLAGKTGTAQIGLQGDRYNKWMIGYGPYTKPRWAVAVLINDIADAKDGRAHIIFRQLMERMNQLSEK